MIIAWAFVIKDLAITIFSDFACVALKFVKIFVISDFTSQWNVLFQKISTLTPEKVLRFTFPSPPPPPLSTPSNFRFRGHQAPLFPQNFQYLKTPLWKL